MIDKFKLQVLTIDDEKRSHLVQVKELLRAGAKWIQYRNKSQSYSEYKEEIVEVAQLCKEAECILIVNDSIDALSTSKADGIHLGKSDLHPQVVRNVVGPKKIIGATVNSLDDATRILDIQAKSLDQTKPIINYVGLGPFSHTTTKENLADILESTQIQEILKVLKGIPVVLIGGISQSNLSAALKESPQGIAVSSAISLSEDIPSSFKIFQETIHESI